MIPLDRPATISLTAAAFLAILLSLAPDEASGQSPSREPAKPAWTVTKVEKRKGLQVSLSTPVLVARRNNYLWFPTLARLGKSDLLAVMSDYADVHTKTSTSQVAWSRDGGLTWSKTKQALYGDSYLRQKNGDHLLLPYYLYPRKPGMGAPYQMIPKGKQELRVVKEGVTVTGWPRPDRTFEPKVGMSGFVFNGQTLELKGGGYLATLYGYFKDDKRYSLVAAESADGVKWSIRSIIAGAACKLKGAEGPCEAALCRLKDGRLMCVFRLASNVPYGQTWSKDEGKTWTEAVAMAGPFSVQPSLAVLPGGMVVLSGGRPGLYAWFNLDGTGKDWQRVDLLAHHNVCHPEERIKTPGNTSSYTEVVAMDDKHLLFIYDRIPHSWHAIPKGSRDTNSVWVTRITVEKTGQAAERWIQATAHAIPKETTNQGSGYFSIVTGKNGRLYIGTAKYGVGSFLVEFDPRTNRMRVVVDTHKAIGTTARGFAAQSKIHTRNNVGASGKIYFATKQGYPDKAKGEKFTDYPGGYPMVYDPKTDKTRVYPIPIPHHGIISITPDESRGIAYISTCADQRPESSHFMILDLKTGKYRDLIDCHHMFAFIVIDYLGRAYHPISGGDIARYDPRTGKVERLKQTIDGKPPTKASLLALPETHPINWDISPDGKTLYSLPMSGNQLYSYDLTARGNTLPGKSLGKLLPDAKDTDCRAMCVGPRGEVWAAVTGTFGKVSYLLHLASYRPGDKAPRDHGPVGIRNPDYTEFKDKSGKPLPNHLGMRKMPDGTVTTQYVILGVSQAQDGTVYALALSPYTLLQIPPSARK